MPHNPTALFLSLHAKKKNWFWQEFIKRYILITPQPLNQENHKNENPARKHNTDSVHNYAYIASMIFTDQLQSPWNEQAASQLSQPETAVAEAHLNPQPHLSLHCQWWVVPQPPRPRVAARRPAVRGLKEGKSGWRNREAEAVCMASADRSAGSALACQSLKGSQCHRWYGNTAIFTSLWIRKQAGQMCAIEKSWAPGRVSSSSSSSRTLSSVQLCSVLLCSVDFLWMAAPRIHFYDLP